jgi:phospholipid/cholesterol/gamma-HCH transport system permease protein
MQPAIENEASGPKLVYRISGEWTVDHAEACLGATEAIKVATGQSAVIHCGGLEHIDITGAWMLDRKIDALRLTGATIALEGFRPEHFRFIEHVDALFHHTGQVLEREELPRKRRLRLGLFAYYVRMLLNSLSFTGWCLTAAGQTLLHPSRFRFRAFIKQCEAAAVRAAPIIGLISFLIAIVTAYQGAAQLKRFGADIFSINLVTISVLREMGVLLAAIMLAGRSGSAFAAEIGTMKLNEEIDALKTTGLDPMEVLVLPRILALVVMTPLLAFFADMMGLLGSGVQMTVSSNTNWLLYLSQLATAVRINDFWIGLSKAPVFGLIIGITGCFHGMSVTNSAESVGKETTNAVVNAIFLVMCADAIFSIVFTMINL